MLKSFRQYVLGDVFPRWFCIITGSELWLSLGVGFLIFKYGSFSQLALVQNGEIGTLILTYAAIALGFTLTGMTIVLTLPDREFARKLAFSKVNKSGRDAYSDLLFVFSWTAIVHWALLMVVVFFLFYFGFKNQILSVLSLKRQLFMGTVGFLITYCLCQFLITVITLTQVGNLYIKIFHQQGEGVTKD